MIEFSLGKLVLLALIALIVLGPEKLPGAARTAGALLRRVRSGWDDVRAEVERELEVEQIRRAARDAAAQAEAAQQEIKDGLSQVHEPLAKVVDDVVATGQPPTGRMIDAPDAIAQAPIEDAPIEQAPIEQVSASPQAELPLGEPAAREPASNTRHAHDDA